MPFLFIQVIEWYISMFNYHNASLSRKLFQVTIKIIIYINSIYVFDIIDNTSIHRYVVCCNKICIELCKHKYISMLIYF